MVKFELRFHAFIQRFGGTLIILIGKTRFLKFNSHDV